MGPQSSAPQDKVARAPLTMEACVAWGKPVRAQVEVGKEVQVTTTATPHSPIPRRVEISGVRGKPVRVLVEALGGIPKNPPHSSPEQCIAGSRLVIIGGLGVPVIQVMLTSCVYTCKSVPRRSSVWHDGPASQST